MTPSRGRAVALSAASGILAALGCNRTAGPPSPPPMPEYPPPAPSMSKRASSPTPIATDDDEPNADDQRWIFENKKRPNVQKACCKALNECKGKGWCKTAKHACKGMNDCKAQGGCKPSSCP